MHRRTDDRWPRRRLRHLALPAVLAVFLAGCGDTPDDFAAVEFEAPGTRVDYEAEVVGAPTDEVAALMRESLLLFRRQEDGAQSLAFLRRRAAGDLETAQTILRSFGYYAAAVEYEVVPLDTTAEEAPETDLPLVDPVETPGPEEAGEPAEVSRARAAVVIDPGPPFILTSHDFVPAGDDPLPQGLQPPGAYGSPVGEPAAAAGILLAEQNAVSFMRAVGYPYAERTGRDAVADPPAATLEVDTAFSPGSFHRFGPIGFEGAPNVEDGYLLTYLPWQPGAEIDASLLAAYQRELIGTGLFRSASVNLPPEPPEGELAPVTVRLEEAPFRSVSAGARFSSDIGPQVRLSFEHRNLFGANETFRSVLDASIDQQILDFSYREPQFWRPGQDFVNTLQLRRIEDSDRFNFDELGATLTSGFTREVGRFWTVGYGGLLEYSRITDNEGERNAYLAGIPTFAAFDGTNDLLNPVTGSRLRFDVTPFAGQFDGDVTNFLVLDSRASVYRSLDVESDYVVAGRVRLGSILTQQDFDDIPQTRRLYSGGAGSVRGFEQNFIGPLDDENDPIGGRSVVEAGLELRFPVWSDIGGAVFVEGGSVSREIFPDFEEGFQVAAGAGVRYYSPVGPIRVDFGFPLNPRDEDDTFQFYISIGQAF